MDYGDESTFTVEVTSVAAVDFKYRENDKLGMESLLLNGDIIFSRELRFFFLWLNAFRTNKICLAGYKINRHIN